MPGDFPDDGSVWPGIDMVFGDCLHRKIIAENNAYGVVFDSLRAADLFPRLGLWMKGHTGKRALNGANVSIAFDPPHVFAVFCFSLEGGGRPGGPAIELLDTSAEWPAVPEGQPSPDVRCDTSGEASHLVESD